jgi:hypothetical protein
MKHETRMWVAASMEELEELLRDASFNVQHLSDENVQKTIREVLLEICHLSETLRDAKDV